MKHFKPYFFTSLLVAGLSVTNQISLAKLNNHIHLTEAPQEEIALAGLVKSAETGETIPSVSIIADGKAVGVTDVNGKFQVKVPRGAEVRFQYMGYQPYSTRFTEDNQSLLISLGSASTDLSEVVVTALGIKRDEKALGYSVSKLDNKDLTEAMPNNWSEALKGKVAGLNITQASSGPLNTSRINLRGNLSLDPAKNQALIVVDGIPMINGNISSGVDQAYGAGASGADKDIPIDFGNGLGDINPDDIESITVLKGAAATALYGSRAGNGALIITTKSGAKHEGGIGITINSNTSISDILRWPDYQYEYGQGVQNRNAAGELYYSYDLSEDGANTGSTSSAFGPKFDGQSYFQYDPATGAQSATRVPWVPYKDNIKSFWRTGTNFTNSVALDGATDRFSARASITHTKNKWIMPNTGFDRLVASLNTSAQLTEKLKLNAKLSFTNKNSDNLPGTGYNNQSIGYFMIFQNPNVDLDWYRPIWKPGMENIEQIHPFSSFIENPFLIAYEMTNSLRSTNLEGNLQGIYSFNSKWELMLRSGLNMRQDQREQRRPYNTANFPQGYYKQQDVFFKETNTDGLLTYRDKLSEDFSFTGSVGANFMHNQIRTSNGVARGLMVPGIYKLSNALTQAVAENQTVERKTHSVYGLINIGWKDKIFLDVTGRNDWSSTLPDGNNSYFYPSVSSSYVLSDLFELPELISFAKARLSWAQVGTDTDPYRTRSYFETSPFPGSAGAPAILFNDDLKPEISTSWEGGVNFMLFNNRINADVNLYTNNTVNQVLRVPLDVTTGYQERFINAGKIQNQGVEILLSGKPIVSKDFNWNTTITWAKNVNKILTLSEDMGVDQQLYAESGTVYFYATKGGSIGDLYGYGLVRNEAGQVVFDAKTGLALRPTDIEKIGNAYPLWRGGFQNEFSYKNWRLSISIDGQYGGIVYSQSHHKMTEQGKLGHTLLGRETGTVVGDGVVQNADGSYSPNTTPVAINTWYADYYRRANVETNSFDASYVKLREARIEYALPKELCKKLRVGGASIAVFGRDLAMISKFPIFDPETAALNGATIIPGVEMGQMPTPRTWGMNLNVKF
ncbi:MULTISPECIES: SusC/RagA family TonB-linked outer membrane protein [Olivibacter]|uniref:SusC/RagA family TonB-linked outer membrane protein n=1 Tax=Olivibacter jilunii TaxID=985016 RepID=A0ABW6BC86_9SPHI|nr:SusC/RagA family TonB-linked outer membrane protein [Olivibacter sp. UJ_SKK_5.1]